MAFTVCKKVGTLRSYSDVAIGFLLLEPASPGRTCAVAQYKTNIPDSADPRFGPEDRPSPGSVNVREGSTVPPRETGERMSERDTHCILVDAGHELLVLAPHSCKFVTTDR
jgi:hypothetical protein